MKRDKAIEEDLLNLGLNKYEARVYLALLERQSLDTAEISRISGVPRARTYDILDGLTGRGLASLKPGKTKRYSAADFESFRNKILADALQEFNDRERKIQSISLTLKRKIEDVYRDKERHTDPIEYIDILREPFQVHRRYLKLLAEAKYEILGFSKPPYSGRQLLEDQLKEQYDRLKKGIRNRGIWEIPSSEEEKRWLYQTIELASHYGDESRVISLLPLKLVIFDERTVLFALEDPILAKTSMTSLVVVHPSLARTLKIAFESIWTQAEDYHVLLTSNNQDKGGIIEENGK